MPRHAFLGGKCESRAAKGAKSNAFHPYMAVHCKYSVALTRFGFVHGNKVAIYHLDGDMSRRILCHA